MLIPITFPFYKQPDSKDCGPTCLKIVAKYYGETINMQSIKTLSETTREVNNLLTLSESAKKIGFRTLEVKLSVEILLEAPLPCILQWNNIIMWWYIKLEVGSWESTSGPCPVGIDC